MAKDMRAAATNEATSSAGEATGGPAPKESQTTQAAPVTAATPSTAPPDPAVKPDPAMAAIEALRQEMRDRDAAARDREEALTQQNKSLQRQLDDMAAAIESRPPSVSVTPVDKRPTEAEKLQNLLNQQQAAIDGGLAKLAEGPLQFTCDVTGEPRSSRLVGAVDHLHARAKYEEFMGIRAILDPDKRINVTPATSAVAG